MTVHENECRGTTLVEDLRKRAYRGAGLDKAYEVITAKLQQVASTGSFDWSGDWLELEHMVDSRLSETNCRCLMEMFAAQGVMCSLRDGRFSFWW